MATCWLGLTGDDLKDIGIVSLGHRKKLLEAIAALAAAPAASQPARVAGTAERRQLTVMFVDLVGSTGLSARLDPEAMSEVLRGYQNAVAGEIARLEGYVAKFMGDGVLAYFGWPRAHEDDAERAVRAGLAIVAAVARLTAGGERAGLPRRHRHRAGGGGRSGRRGCGAGARRSSATRPTWRPGCRRWPSPGRWWSPRRTRRLLGELFELARSRARMR